MIDISWDGTTWLNPDPIPTFGGDTTRWAHTSFHSTTCGTDAVSNNVTIGYMYHLPPGFTGTSRKFPVVYVTTLGGGSDETTIFNRTGASEPLADSSYSSNPEGITTWTANWGVNANCVVIFNNGSRATYGMDSSSSAPMFGKEMIVQEMEELINVVESTSHPIFGGRLVPQGTSDPNGNKYRGIMGHSGGTISSAHMVAMHPDRYASCYLLAAIGVHYYGDSNAACINWTNSNKTYWDNNQAISDGIDIAVGPGQSFLTAASAIASNGVVFHVQTSSGEGAQGQAIAFASAMAGLGITCDPLETIPFTWHTFWAMTTQPLPWHVSKFKLQPVLNPASYSTPINTPLLIPVATLMSGDTDPQLLTLSVTSVGSPTHGTVSMAGGTVTFTPTAGYVGPASFQYTEQNTDINPGTSTNWNATATVNVNVTSSGGGGAPLTTQISDTPSHVALTDNSGTVNITDSALLQTTTTIASSSNPSTPGASVVFTVTVSSTSGTPTGQVWIQDYGGMIFLGPLSGGSTTFAISTLSAGNHNIVACYDGDGGVTYDSSCSGVLVQQVTSGGGGGPPGGWHGRGHFR